METQSNILPSLTSLFEEGDVSRFIWYVFGAIVALFVIYSAILAYHWLRYGLERRVIRLTLSVYFAIAIILIVILALATLNLAL